MANNDEFEALKHKITWVLREHSVKRAGIFGSYAKGEQTKHSDVDVLIEADEDADLVDIIGIKLSLEKATQKKIDLVEYSTIRPELKESILSGEIPLNL